MYADCRKSYIDISKVARFTILETMCLFMTIDKCYWSFPPSYLTLNLRSISFPVDQKFHQTAGLSFCTNFLHLFSLCLAYFACITIRFTNLHRLLPNATNVTISNTTEQPVQIESHLFLLFSL